MRGTTLWKNICKSSEKMLESVTVFKNSMNKKLLELENKIGISKSNCFKH